MNAPDGYKRYHVSLPVIIDEVKEGVEPRAVSMDDPKDAERAAKLAKLIHIQVHATSPEHAAHILWERIDAALSDP